MNRKKIDQLTDDLALILDELIEQQATLHDGVRAKLEAMRRADTEEMIALSHHEGGIVSQINALDRRRRQVITEFASALSLPIHDGADHLSLPVLAERLEERHRTRLTRLGAALREKMLQVAEANRVVELVSREMLAHFDNLFSAFTQDENEPRIYSRGGAMEDGAGAKVLDAVG
ncbi:MAG: flagellar export chaperone FlgN [Phycisphaerae bacterium]